ncbi:hypothetical protein BI364_02525 [Acidihalobacter yilgarnensis]|uniref:Zinc finger/thioredoxin putative domain-containing protein n=1 Tax=Acidihalobacter yilgarnensis TaxID=2819280 RepID=A0A1D8IKN5_9GAMM|nr:DUF3426 domain-containing protein [Acidihalobacter yilgarnensis]AOU97026.1 hypothetical protein BI364_02525 [Acidihalobacter yilgarnensis]
MTGYAASAAGRILEGTMYVECPQCHALYRISRHQLAAADGWVRCGECNHIFEARETLSDEDEKHPQLPLGYPDDIPTEPALDPEPSDCSPVEATADTVAKTHRKRWIATLLWSLGILALLTLLAGQYVLSIRDQLAETPMLRPWLTRLCELRGCTLPPLRALNRIELLSRNVFTHPNIAHALMLTATIDNTAPFPQPYPALQISFSNLQGQVVAIGRFKPAQYLPPNINPAHLMPPDTPVSISVSFKDPGAQAVSYEFSFH